MDKYNNITNFDQLIEVEHGKIGTESRNKYEENTQMFINIQISTLIRLFELGLNKRIGLTFL
jgi:hypothetical protein